MLASTRVHSGLSLRKGSIKPVSPVRSRDQLRSVCFAGGGSGGHLNISIAIAEQLCADHISNRQLCHNKCSAHGSAADGSAGDESAATGADPRQQRMKLLFLVSERPVDQQVFSQLSMHPDSGSAKSPGFGSDICLNCIPLPLRSGPRRALHPSGILRMLRAIWISRRMLKAHGVQIVVGVGGFASLPGVIAARWLRIPILLIEQNVVPGRATRFLSRFAGLTCAGWPLRPEFQATIRSPVLNTGIPLRNTFLRAIEQMKLECQRTAEDAAANAPTQLPLFIVGGSQGSRRLNEILLSALQRAPEVFSRFQICHQTGQTDCQELSRVYSHHAIDARIVEFVSDMAGQLRSSSSSSSSTLVITRAGATTLAEIHAVQVTAIVIPLSTSADDHQRCNAQYFADVADAVVLDETAESADMDLIALLQRFLIQRHFHNTTFDPSRAERPDPQHVRRMIVQQIHRLSGVSSHEDLTLKTTD